MWLSIAAESFRTILYYIRYVLLALGLLYIVSKRAIAREESE